MNFTKLKLEEDVDVQGPSGDVTSLKAGIVEIGKDCSLEEAKILLSSGMACYEAQHVKEQVESAVENEKKSKEK